MFFSLQSLEIIWYVTWRKIRNTVKSTVSFINRCCISTGYTHNRDIYTVWWGEHFVSPDFCLMYTFQSNFAFEVTLLFLQFFFFFPLMWKMFEVWTTPFVRKSCISLWKPSSKLRVAVGRKSLYESSYCLKQLS